MNDRQAAEARAAQTGRIDRPDAGVECDGARSRFQRQVVGFGELRIERGRVGEQEIAGDSDSGRDLQVGF